MNCIYCCRKEEIKNRKSEPETSEMIETIKQIIQCRGTFVVIQGGEPLLRDDAAKLIEEMGRLKRVVPGYYLRSLKKIMTEEHAAKKFASCYRRVLIEQHLPLYCLTTNGMTYSEDISEALYNSGFSLEISLDSPYEEVNKMTRPGIDFKSVTRNINLFAATLPVEISCTITEYNVSGIQDMISFADDMGCICVKYSPVIMIGKRKDGNISWEEEYLNSIELALEKHKTHKQRLFLKVKLSGHMLDSERGKAVYNKLLDSTNVLVELHECAAFKQIKDVYIDTDLNVYGCASMKNDKSLIIGNLKDKTLKEIWNSEQRERLSQEISCLIGNSAENGSCTAVAYIRKKGSNK